MWAKIEYESDFNNEFSMIKGNCVYYICEQCAEEYDEMLQGTKEKFFKEKEEQLVSKFKK